MISKKGSFPMNSPKHYLSFDYLRILACFGVVMLHASAYYWLNRPILTMDWYVANAYNVLTRISVPLFVMISGALFLNPSKKLSTKKLWTTHILRLFLLYGLWMFLYGFISYLQTGGFDQGLKKLILSVLTGRYHLWFLPMLIGIYAMLPLLRTWTGSASEKEIQYFFTLFLVFQILATSVGSFLHRQEVTSIIEQFQWAELCNYVGYFVLGHYLFHLEIPEKRERLLYVSIPFCFLGNFLISSLQTLQTGVAQSAFLDSFGIFTFIATVGVFRLFTQKTGKGTNDGNPVKIIGFIARGTLGIYLMHLLVMEMTPVSYLFGLPVIVAIPCISIATFLISLIISALLVRIPLIGKYVC